MSHVFDHAKGYRKTEIQNVDQCMPVSLETGLQWMGFPSLVDFDWLTARTHDVTHVKMKILK